MDIWRPVQITRFRSDDAVSWTVVEPRKQSVGLRIARMEPILLVPAGLAGLVVFWPLAAFFGAPGAVAMLLLAAATPVAGYQRVRRRVASAFGPTWRISRITAAHFRNLPADQGRLVREMAEHLDGMWSSQAARAGWLTADKLREAHSAVWRSALLLLGTADQHLLLRESARYAELEHLVAVRAGELAGAEAVVRDVARQLGQAHATVVKLDALIDAEQERLAREQHVAFLESRLISGRTVGVQTMPPAWQDDLDAINACVEAALIVLSPDLRG